MTQVFDHSVRALLCDNCGGLLPLANEGGSVTCRYCNASNLIAVRPGPTHGSMSYGPSIATQAGPGDAVAEAARLNVLRRQDGQWMKIPSHLLQYRPGFLVRERQQTKAQWAFRDAALAVRQGGGETEERTLFVLTHYLEKLHEMRADYLRQRAVLETGLESMKSPQFRQILQCALARGAVRLGETAAATAWLADCDPRPTDIHMDTAYRMTSSFIATSRGDYNAVLMAVGSVRDVVPIAQDEDHLAALLRANALERLGREDEAVVQLLAATEDLGGLQTLESEFLVNRRLGLCPRSFPVARDRVPFSRRSFAFVPLAVLLPLFVGTFGFGLLLVFGASIAGGVVLLIIAALTSWVILGTLRSRRGVLGRLHALRALHAHEQSGR